MTGEAVVAGGSIETIEISVCVSVVVDSSSLADGVAVMVMSFVAVSVTNMVVGAGVVEGPPSIGTTEYVARGRTAWNLGRCCSLSSASGIDAERAGKEERSARSGTGRVYRRIAGMVAPKGDGYR